MQTSIPLLRLGGNLCFCGSSVTFTQSFNMLELCIR